MNVQTKEEIQNALKKAHLEFIEYLSQMERERFEYSPDGIKWSAAQQLEHIHKSTRPLRKALKLPKFILKWRVGTSNRPSRDYSGLVARYDERLEGVQGITAKISAPSQTMIGSRAGLAKAIENDIEAICKSLKRYSESQLDLYILPHPLLGKVTVREMMFFTIYHVQHHHAIIESMLTGFKR